MVNILDDFCVFVNEEAVGKLNDVTDPRSINVSIVFMVFRFNRFGDLIVSLHFTIVTVTVFSVPCSVVFLENFVTFHDL